MARRTGGLEVRGSVAGVDERRGRDEASLTDPYGDLSTGYQSVRELLSAEAAMIMVEGV